MRSVSKGVLPYKDVFEVVVDEGSDCMGGVQVAEALRALVGVNVDEDGATSASARFGRRDSSILDHFRVGVEYEGLWIRR